MDDAKLRLDALFVGGFVPEIGVDALEVDADAETDAGKLEPDLTRRDAVVVAVADLTL